METSKEGRTLDLKKKLTDDFNIGLELQQMYPQSSTQAQQPEYSKKLEGEMLVTDKLSVNFGQEILHSQNTGSFSTSDPSADPHHQNESEILLKYKNTF